MQWKLEKTQAFIIRKSGHNTGLPKNFSLSADKDFLSSAQIFSSSRFPCCSWWKKNKANNLLCFGFCPSCLSSPYGVTIDSAIQILFCSLRNMGREDLLNSVKAKHPSVIWHLCGRQSFWKAGLSCPLQLFIPQFKLLTACHNAHLSTSLDVILLMQKEFHPHFVATAW